MFHCPGVTEPLAPSMGNGPLGETGMGWSATSGSWSYLGYRQWCIYWYIALQNKENQTNYKFLLSSGMYYSHHGRFPAIDTMSLTSKLGRDVQPLALTLWTLPRVPAHALAAGLLGCEELWDKCYVREMASWDERALSFPARPQVWFLKLSLISADHICLRCRDVPTHPWPPRNTTTSASWGEPTASGIFTASAWGRTTLNLSHPHLLAWGWVL